MLFLPPKTFFMPLHPASLALLFTLTSTLQLLIRLGQANFFRSKISNLWRDLKQGIECLPILICNDRNLAPNLTILAWIVLRWPTLVLLGQDKAGLIYYFWTQVAYCEISVWCVVCMSFFQCCNDLCFHIAALPIDFFDCSAKWWIQSFVQFMTVIVKSQTTV